jgi:hypothetical protein
MSQTDDYLDEMGKSVISDPDVERILRGDLPEDPGLAALTSTIAVLAKFRNRAPAPEVTARHVTLAADAAREASLPQPDRRPAARAISFRLLPRIGVSLAALALVVGMTGVAVASDAASPGDPLHGIDMALEKIGIGDGGPAERITEARDLNERGLTLEALSHLSIAFSHHNDRPAADALKTAAERIREKGISGEGIEEIHIGVSDMLDWMANNDPKSPGFGQAVAERAKALGHPPIEGADGEGPGNSDDRGNGPGGPPPGKGPGS